MEKRPASVTVIAWFLLVTSAISVIQTAPTWNDLLVQEILAKMPIPVPMQLGLTALGLLVNVACAIGFLKGVNAARTLYVVYSILALIVGWFISPMKMMLIPGAVIVAVLAFFIYRPAANRFFNQTATS